LSSLQEHCCWKDIDAEISAGNGELLVYTAGALYGRTSPCVIVYPSRKVYTSENFPDSIPTFRIGILLSREKSTVDT
ncbi:hypothetical protein ACLI1Y_17180, partial [Enterococcus faecalis]|uniref:hypothetical protein n=1 Tax=Enterococcus faecalis TaxID=1351 RepID=UPI0039851499